MDLKTRAVRSTAWFAATRILMQAASWIVTIVIARLLTPEDYGLFGMAFAAIAFLELFQEFGFGVALIQKQDLTKQDINGVFWLVVMLGLLVSALTLVVAPLAGRFYGNPDLVWIVRILGLTFLINAIGMVPFNLLTKDIDFRQRSLGEALGVVTSSAVSVGLAVNGYGVGALIGGHLIRVATCSTAYILFCDWKPGVHVSFARIHELTRIGFPVAGAGVFGTLADIARTVIVGRLLGDSMLGLYRMADALGVNAFQKLFTSVLNQLSLPVFSKVQADQKDLQRYFLTITKYLAILSCPLQIGTAIVAEDLTRALLSDKWLPIVQPLQVFSVGSLFYVLALPAAPLLTARGRVNIILRYAALSTVLTIVTFLVGASVSLLGAVVAWAISFPTVRVAALAHAIREIDLSLRSYVHNIAPALVATLFMAGVLLAGRHLAVWPDDLWLRLTLEGIVAALTYTGVILLGDRSFAPELRSIVFRLRTAPNG